MDQVQTSTLLHYRFWWFNRRLMEMHTQGHFHWLSFLWPRTNDTLWVIHACQPEESLETTVDWASLRWVLKNKGILPKALPKNRFMSVVFNTRMSWWLPTNRDPWMSYSPPSRPHDPREFRWKHHKYSTSVTRNLQIFPRKLGCANHGEKSKCFEFRFENLQTTSNNNRRPQVDLPWWIASLQDNLASRHFQQFWVPFGEFKRLNSLELQAVPHGFDVSTKWFD